MQLKSMTDYIIDEYELEGNEKTPNFNIMANKTYNYANFLKQPLKLWMFIPCDEDNNILKLPLDCSCYGYIEDCTGCEFTDITYQEAKERCLFEGFKFQEANEDYPAPFIYLGEDIDLYPEIWKENDTIEDLLYYKEFIILSQTAIKQLNI